MAKLYLYLARRDKKGLRVISVFDGPETPPVRLQDVSLLHLPRHMEADISRAIHENRMYWEPWLETAESYEALKRSVRARGYTSVPIHGNAVVPAQLTPVQTPMQQTAQTMMRKIRTDA